jgi:Mrp family chromosome partitioning ATPase
MGRILEALTLPDTQEASAAEPAAPDLHCVCQTDAPAEEAETSEEVPYIEVGPRKSMEASASVLATSPPPHYGGGSPAIHATPPPPNGEGSSAVHPNPPLYGGSPLAPELLAYHRPEHAVSQQYCRLLDPLLALAPNGRTQVLLFSAARPGCGTTTVLLNVAITAARHAHRRVVVVDGNLRHPALGERLGLAEVGGFREVLNGGLTLEQALRETDQINLFALTAGKTPTGYGPASGIRLVSETVRSLLRQLRHRFDLVLVDGPRWDGQQDVILLGSACDAVYLVVAEEEAESSQVDDLFQAIPEQGGRLAGCILAGR